MSENATMATNLDAYKSSNKSKGLTCYPCSLEEKQTDAHCFCVQCVEHLCTSCARDHRKIKITRSHVLLDGEEMPNDVSTFEEMAKLTFCKVHIEREIEFKCDSHNDFICSICFRETHRTCDNVIPVSELVVDKQSFKSDYFEKQFALKSVIEKELQNYVNLSDNNDTAEIFNQMQSISDELQSLTMQVDTEKTE